MMRGLVGAITCALASLAVAHELSNEFALSDDLFDGDIVTDVTQVTEFFGAAVASDLRSRGVLLDDPDRRTLGASRTSGLWNVHRVNGRAQVPYSIDAALASQADNIHSVLAAFGDRIRYVEFVRRTTETAYVKIIKESGCWSYVGRLGRAQELSLGNGCTQRSTIEHEMMHALGFWHEQSRPDRESYVEVFTNKVRSGFRHNYNMLSAMNIDSRGIPYDPRSVMHYFNGAFGKSRPVCALEGAARCGQVAFVRLQDQGVDAPDMCLDARDPDGLQLQPCSASAGATQRFIVENAGDSTVRLKLASAPDQCVDDSSSWGDAKLVNDAPLVLRDCSALTNEFQLHGASVADVRIHWDGDAPLACMSRKQAGASSAQTQSGAEVSLRSCGSANQQWTLDFETHSSAPAGCSAAPLCSRFSGRENTMRALDGGSIGGSSKATDSDVLQLQLLYKCSAPRSFSEFCSEDCLCDVGEGACSSDNQCKAGLACQSGLCAAQTGTTRIPSTAPTKLTILEVSTSRPSLRPSSAPTSRPSHPITARPSLSPVTPRPTRAPSTACFALCAQKLPRASRNWSSRRRTRVCSAPTRSAADCVCARVGRSCQPST